MASRMARGCTSTHPTLFTKGIGAMVINRALGSSLYRTNTDILGNGGTTKSTAKALTFTPTGRSTRESGFEIKRMALVSTNTKTEMSI